MLLTNQWFDKLSVSCAHFTANSMLHGDCLSETLAMFHKLYYFSTELTAVNKQICLEQIHTSEIDETAPQDKDEDTKDTDVDVEER